MYWDLLYSGLIDFWVDWLGCGGFWYVMTICEQGFSFCFKTEERLYFDELDYELDTFWNGMNLRV